MSQETFPRAVLKQLREKLGLTQKELADSIQVTREYVARLESDPDVSPSWKTVQLLAKALGVSTEKLKGVVESPNPAKRKTPKPAKSKTPKKGGA